MKKISAFILAIVMLFMLCACGKIDMEFERTSVESISETTDTADEVQANSALEDISGN